MKQYDEGLFGDYRGLTFIWDYAGLSKLLLLEGMNSSSIVVWRFCFSTVFCLAIMLIKKDPVSGNPQTNRRYDSGRNIRIWYDGHSGDSRL